MRAPSAEAPWLEGALRAAGPPLIFGLRLWASVCLALYVAFWLQLDDPFWAGTSAAIVCQPQLGASLRKGWFRMIGTLTGAVVSVVLIACLPQERVLFLGCLALWAGICAGLATLLRNFASYGAALAGYTVAIICGGLLGLTGGVNANAGFLLAVARASEICLGIACAGVVLTLSDFGGARRRLAALIAAVSSGIAGGFVATLRSAGAGFEDTQDLRRELLRQVIALDPVIDQAFGESSELRYYSPVLQRAVEGLYVTLAGWRTASVLLWKLPREPAREAANSVLLEVPAELRVDDGTDWVEQPVILRRSVYRAARRLMTTPVATPSVRLLADKTAAALSSLSLVLDALALLVADPTRRVPRRHGIRHLNIPDWQPAAVAAGRTFVTVAAAALFWIVTAWPGGAQVIIFAAIVSILMAPHADRAYAAALLGVIGILLDLIVTATVNYAVLPASGFESFAGLMVILACCLVPLGFLLVWAQSPVLAGLSNVMTMIFMPLLAPTNQMNYDVAAFYNTSLGIVVGASAAALTFRLIPPPSPARRTRRLLDLASRDLKRLLRRRVVPTVHVWDQRGIGRLSGLPDSAEPLQRAQLLAVVLVGAEIIRLHRSARRFGLDPLLSAALTRLAHGDVAGATDGLAQIDHQLAARQTPAAVRARARILAISGALEQHPTHFALLGAA